MTLLNDDLADAIELAGASGTVTFDITGATLEAGETEWGGDGHTVWFKHTPADDGTLHLTTSGTPSPRWDSTIAVYTGTGFADFVLEASDDDGDLQPGISTPDGFGTSGLTVDVTAGTTYWIQVDSYAYPSDGTNPSAGYPRADCELAWTFAYHPPSLGSVTPDHGKFGTAVTISGTHLSTATAVHFGAVAAAFTIVDDNTITSTLPDLGAAAASTVQVTGPGGTDSLPFQPWYPGPWVQPATDWWGERRSPFESWWFSSREWSPAAQSDLYGPADGSAATFAGLSSGTAQEIIDTASGVYARQDVALVDTQPIWDNTAFTYDLDFTLDPHPAAALDLSDPAAVVDGGLTVYEWEHDPGSHPYTFHATFAGRYRFEIARGGSGTVHGTGNGQLRRVPSGDYTYSRPGAAGGSSPALVGGWLFPGYLSGRDLLASFDITASDYGSYEIDETDLDDRKHALALTLESYVAESPVSVDTAFAVLQVYVRFLSTPDRYRLFYTVPQVAATAEPWTVGAVRL